MNFPYRCRFLIPLFLSTSAFSAVTAQETNLYVAGTKPLPPLPKGDGVFTLVIIPDTQSYRGRDCKQTPDSNDPVTIQILRRR